MRIAGITIPDNKQLVFGLTAIYGVGRSQAARILDAAQVPHTKQPAGLKTAEENAVREHVEALSIEGELRRLVAGNIKRLKDIKSYRGSLHTKRLPARGQRTKTNARTLKGVRKTMGSGRRKLEKT